MAPKILISKLFNSCPFAGLRVPHGPVILLESHAAAGKRVLNPPGDVSASRPRVCVLTQLMTRGCINDVSKSLQLLSLNPVVPVVK